MSGFDEAQREALHDDAMAAAKRCIRLVVEGDPESPPAARSRRPTGRRTLKPRSRWCRRHGRFEDGPRR